MSEITLQTLHDLIVRQGGELRNEMAAIRARINGLPLLEKAIEVLQRDVRLLRSAVNDMARVNLTAGEAQALHDDVDQTMILVRDLAARVATIEQEIAKDR